VCPSTSAQTNGQETVENADTQMLYIMAGSPWEKGHCGSVHGRPGDDLLNGEDYHTLREPWALLEG